MTNLAERQNDEEQLKYQYTARVHYNCAEIDNILVWVFCFGSAVTGFLGLSDMATLVLVVCFDLLGIFFGYLFGKNIETAGMLRQVFDRRLFGMDLGLKAGDIDKLKEIVERTILKKRDDYNVQITNTGKDNPPGVRDWYTAPAMGHDGKDIVFQCQKENIWFSKKMLYAKLTMNSVSLLIIVSIGIYAFRGKSLWEIIILAMACMALIVRFISRVKVLLEDFRASIVINTLVDNYGEMKQNKASILLQNAIEERRKLHLVYSSYAHSKMAHKLHELFQAMN